MNAAGNGHRPVQRAIRSAGHCEFNGAELAEAFTDLVKWEATGVKPAGDDVTTPTVIADLSCACQFTRATRIGGAACQLNANPSEPARAGNGPWSRI
ncbi:hypothetical protein LAJ19_03500 [Deinococcus taeanensis]|uniref:hypothetical protein n=1 Tax=Deinococcus taeanensis TaxID=2737050 RepID=UPI001CDD6D35|nr:hypothetical protein [Deinococcus taeanensis]UBV43291.1 hypothetical protein LAJ19_03500 [Deinococcus taeanensis]